MASRVIVLTGERSAGKSTVCRETITLVQAHGYTCSGILTLSQPDGTLEVLDVCSGDTRRLTIEPGTNGDIVQGRFCFDPETLSWGNTVLAQAHARQLFVVDELGPLEVERGGGWVKAFDVLRRKNFALALAVVRPELVVRAQLRLPSSAATVITVTPDNRDDLPPLFLEMLEKELGPVSNG